MRLVISSAALFARLSALSKVLSSKNTMPILGCFHIHLANGQMTITASDGEKYMTSKVEVVEMEDGEAMFCIPSQTILDSLKELADQPLTLELDPESHVLKGTHQSGQFIVMSQDASSYPVRQEMSSDAIRMTLPEEVVMNGITRCLFATSNEEVRQVMTGIYFDIKQDCIIFAGTDGRKLVRNINRNAHPGIDGGFILPKKVAAILKAVVPQPQGDFILTVDHDKAFFQAEDFDLYFRLIEGTYPNYNAVIPVNNPFKATVDRLSLISALRRVSVFCNQSSGLMKLQIENNSMRMTGQDLDYATFAEENLMCEYNNSPISIGFSCQYLEEIASILQTETVTIHLADPSRPGLVTPGEQDPNDDVVMLLMPMMLSD